jgi:hypothetical protein
MIEKVLRDKPNSAHAHYVHAQLLARQGLYGEARGELDSAQRLDPGLSFVKPEAVQQLRRLIESAPSARAGTSYSAPGSSYSGGAYSAAGAGGGFPWGLVMLVVIGGGVAYLIARAMRARRVNRMNRSVAAYGQAPGAPGAPYGQPGGPYGPQGPQPYGPGGYPQQGGGLGAGILGGLATGAAVGAGAVAAQSLLHHFTDGDRSDHAGNAAAPPVGGNDYQPFDDMGGDNFGIVDNSSSWDDAGSSGGDDFSGGSDW